MLQPILADLQWLEVLPKSYYGHRLEQFITHNSPFYSGLSLNIYKYSKKRTEKILKKSRHWFDIDSTQVC